MEQHSPSLRGEALALLRQGVRNRTVAERLGVPVGTVGWWLHEDRKARGIVVFERPHNCPRCLGIPIDRPAYAYLLGLYLGDGHVISRGKQNHLSIYCCDDWPGLMDAAEDAMRNVFPGPSTGRRAKIGCTEVKSYSKHWKCLFPQHGPGMKHERRIVLAAWQQEIVDECPWELVRGLIHSDGCRFTNWTTRVVGGKRKRYEYPRYYFTNKSDDIRKIFTDALDVLGVEWTTLARGSDPYNISIARRASVALMDAHVGPKY
jgi:hypothetical protein